MQLGLFFWILFIIAAVFSLYQNRTAFPNWVGGGLLYFILIGVLGWAVFGGAVHH